MWNTFVSELTAQNGAGLEFRLLVIAWFIMIVGVVFHSIYKLMKKKDKTSHITNIKYRKVS